MKIHHVIERPLRPCVLAIGFFDGVHRGHREIVRTLLRLRAPGLHAAVLTFANHPSSFLRPGAEPPLITTLEERVNLLAATGIDELYVLPFDERIASIEGTEFVSRVLLDELDVRALVIGANFRFGARRSGDADLARTLFAPYGREVVAAPHVLSGGERISSTRIRHALTEGRLHDVNELLGRTYTLRGRVTLGKGFGHDFGFPTANLATPVEKTLPADGVYSIVGRYDGRDYVGLVSIGDNPTFGEHKKSVEAWLLDFRETIYGEELVLRDFTFLREQRRFETVDALIAQMHDDATHARFPSFIT